MSIYSKYVYNDPVSDNSIDIGTARSVVRIQ